MSVDQPNTGGGHVILSVPVKLNLQSGANSITFGAGQDSKQFFSLERLWKSVIEKNG